MKHLEESFVVCLEKPPATMILEGDSTRRPLSCTGISKACEAKEPGERVRKVSSVHRQRVSLGCVMIIMVGSSFHLGSGGLIFGTVTLLGVPQPILLKSGKEE